MVLSQDFGIDLGTSNTVVYAKGKGIIIREPSVVAMDVRENPSKVVAVGAEAKTMIGRTPGSITAQKPLKNGVIADYEMTADMLREFIKKAQNLVGSGYTFLVTDHNSNLSIINMPNQETPLSYNLIPLFTIDLWEHAYYLKYQNNKNKYLENIWHKVNFNKASRTYNELF